VEGSCEHGNEPSGSIKYLATSQEGFGSMNELYICTQWGKERTVLQMMINALEKFSQEDLTWETYE
jgi:hypothetical protein